MLHRDADIIPVADARIVAGQIPGATLRILPGRDHLPWVGDWAAVTGEILAFLAQVAPARHRPPDPGGGPGSRPPAAGGGLAVADRCGTPGGAAGRRGPDQAEIAAGLCLSRYTVETHLKHVFAKLGVESRAELAALAAGQAEGAAEYLISGMPRGDADQAGRRGEEEP